MGKRRAILSLLCCLLLCVGLCVPTLAEGDYAIGTTTLQPLSLEGKTLEDISLYGTYYSHGSCEITKTGSGTVYISGSTSCYRVSDEVYVGVYLEQKNGTWNSWDSISTTGYNTYEVQVGKTVAVPKGYYYRVRGAHYAEKGSVYESGTSVSGGIYI